MLLINIDVIIFNNNWQQRTINNLKTIGQFVVQPKFFWILKTINQIPIKFKFWLTILQQLYNKLLHNPNIDFCKFEIYNCNIDEQRIYWWTNQIVQKTFSIFEYYAIIIDMYYDLIFQ